MFTDDTLQLQNNDIWNCEGCKGKSDNRYKTPTECSYHSWKLGGMPNLNCEDATIQKACGSCQGQINKCKNDPDCISAFRDTCGNDCDFSKPKYKLFTCKDLDKPGYKCSQNKLCENLVKCIYNKNN